MFGALPVLSHTTSRRLRPALAGVASGLVAGCLSQSSARADPTSGTWAWAAPAAKASSSEAPKIVVVGSTNIDLIAYCPKLPRPGETLMGTNFVQCFGGKGANREYSQQQLLLSFLV